MRFRNFSVAAFFVALFPLTAAAESPQEPVNVIVYKEPGKFGGWPANHGMWIWGNEIVLGHRVATFQAKKMGHAVDSSQPQYDWQARSLDGGMTWRAEQPAELRRPQDGGPEVTDLDKPIDFTQKDFAFMCRYGSPAGQSVRAPGRKLDPTSRFYYSSDRAKTWHGPYRFPMLGQSRIMARTDCLVSGPYDATLVLTAGKQDGDEGRIFTARTTDGGLNWKFVSWVGPEPTGFAIMPSSVRLSDSKLLTTIRRKEGDQHWIDAYLSTDNGATWSFLNKATESTGGSVGNPPALIKLHDHRLALVYGYRSAPYGIRARLSADEGNTWSKEIILRDDAGTWDLGYPRSVERPDGRIVTAYYYNDHPDQERYIAATIWRPEMPRE